MKKYWCGVVSREHIKRGEEGGFCQVCHGKKSPLARMNVGDGIVFYSPVYEFKGTEKCQKFTAIGEVVGVEPYLFRMSPTFEPYRRDIKYYPSQDVPIVPLLPELTFITNVKRWGFVFRFGHFEMPQADFLRIARLMMGEAADRVFLRGEADEQS